MYSYITGWIYHSNSSHSLQFPLSVTPFIYCNSSYSSHRLESRTECHISYKEMHNYLIKELLFTDCPTLYSQADTVNYLSKNDKKNNWYGQISKLGTFQTITEIKIECHKLRFESLEQLTTNNNTTHIRRSKWNLRGHWFSDDIDQSIEFLSSIWIL